ncbi:MAG TPA: 3-deoxy-manno-octulosonate cytidylyltransferase [Vicinamibacterales bacterium]|nr:3-deoxy-manno-octulosonate cytidylyltransferase [Vicinamibacterales bacterium]
MLRWTVPAPSPAAFARRFPPSEVVAVIPARYGSTRFPGKPLADLAGRPIVEHVYRRVAACEAIGAVVVATDDERIRAVVEAFGGRAVLTSPAHPSGTDRVAEVAETLACELVVNVQGDEPLVEPAMLEQALAPFADDPSLEISTLRCRIRDEAELRSPHVTKVVVDGAGNALYFSRAPIPYAREGGVAGAWKHIGIYVYRRERLLALARLPPTPLERAERLEQLRALEHGVRIRVVETTSETIGVDTPDDLERLRRLVGEALPSGP